METPPLKKQKIGSEDAILSSPLQEEPNIVDVERNVNNTSNDNDDVHDAEDNIIKTLETPTRRSNPVSEQNDTLSPLKPHEENSIPSFKQLISRFNTLVESATNDLNNFESNATDESDLPLVQFASLQNKYENDINSLNAQLHEKLDKINNLNNEIGDYRQKIENMHLAIEESALENNKLQQENDALKLEAKELQNAIDALEKQLSVEKSKSSSLINKINQLKESVEPIFNAYESLHQQITTLRDQNAELQNTVNLQHSKITSFDDTLKNELESLAQELYIQYAEKHEAKISKLRTAYEAKYAQKQSMFTEKHRLLQSQYDTLQQELAHVKSRLQVEASEKRQLVRLWDEYVALDKKDVDQMASFVKKLK
ncbi:hypothetical protein CANINC_001435 [Pichia inconspicua]|uniref:Uncharacterized protein n=1 Tax=Pichia inconspicua TaxID=52247 RepID=A0A4T0X564_9ASCO|nr:hypothetical protein CANINC_001435 [[Candida] inconspicua]